MVFKLNMTENKTSKDLLLPGDIKYWTYNLMQTRVVFLARINENAFKEQSLVEEKR